MASDITALASNLNKQWRELSERYLPFKEENSIWRFSRRTSQELPEQGWKLHVSATIVTACATLKRIAPYLATKDLQFKAPISLDEINKLNSGIHYDYSQIGKVFTVYPLTPSDAVETARRLYELTHHLTGPMVPFDYRYGNDGCVYYRYGSFRYLSIDNPDGTHAAALRKPDGELQVDSRTEPKPAWIDGPLVSSEESKELDVSTSNPLSTRYRVFRVLSQRGKGGVYHAVDLKSNPPRVCVLKEGRKFGELSWDGRDGHARIRHEKQVLKRLRSAGIDVPRVYDSFKLEQNYYLALEYIEGTNLQAWLIKRKRRLTIPQALRLASQFASLVACIHEAGWSWRDCKPGNVIMQADGTLRPLDFEGACPNDSPDGLPWNTDGFTPPSWKAHVQSRRYEDIYALGATLYFLFTGRLLTGHDSPEIKKLRRNVPTEVCDLVSDLTSSQPDQMPCARTVENTMAAMANYFD
jgi:hypothetical protein